MKRWLLAAWLALTGGACQSGLALTDLAQDPPLPYSVVVTGGAFVEPGPEPDPRPALQRTFRPANDLTEAFPLDMFINALVAGRVFVRATPDAERDPVHRSRLVAASRGESPESTLFTEFLEQQRRAGHDFVLMVERVEDGAVEFRGVNGQWPITMATWLLVGLGALIPDHTYESRSSLHIALLDANTGERVLERVSSVGPLNLPLWQRSDWLGLVTSIIVPPFWVGDDDGGVEETVREVAPGRLVVAMARQLKTLDVNTRLGMRMPAALEMERTAAGVEVSIRCSESLSFVRMRVDGEPLATPVFTAFEGDLLASAQLAPQDGLTVYRAVLTQVPAGHRLQLLVQTVTGRVATMTMGLER